MSDHVYDDAHVRISQMIGRKYNNPLGERAFPLLERLARRDGEPFRVLDVGCGRGWTTLWWARRGATVTAFDPSCEMLDEARELVRQEGLEGSVELACADTESFRTEGGFDLAVVHDVLCYSPDATADLRRVLEWCAPGGIVSVTNYFGQAASQMVEAVAQAWAIQPPEDFEDQVRGFEAHARRVLLAGETTRQYRAHWAEMRRRMEADASRLVERVGRDALRRFERQIESIERAVEERRFGHLWAVLESSGPTG